MKTQAEINDLIRENLDVHGQVLTSLSESVQRLLIIIKGYQRRISVLEARVAELRGESQ